MSERKRPTWSADPASIGIETIWRVLIRSLVLIQLALLIACLVVPILGADTDPDDPADSDSDSDSDYGQAGSGPVGPRLAMIIGIGLILVTALLA